MTKRKVKRYDGIEGSMVGEDAGRMSDLSTKVETGEGPQKMQAEPSKPKARIVSKKELEASGLSLRDFLNKERGLDRKQPANWKKHGFYGSETGGDAAVMYRKSMSKGGVARSSASKRADGCAERGHTKGRNV
jgi:hypothetical protein